MWCRFSLAAAYLPHSWAALMHWLTRPHEVHATTGVDWQRREPSCARPVFEQLHMTHVTLPHLYPEWFRSNARLYSLLARSGVITRLTSFCLSAPPRCPRRALHYIVKYHLQELYAWIWHVGENEGDWKPLKTLSSTFSRRPRGLMSICRLTSATTA